MRLHLHCPPTSTVFSFIVFPYFVTVIEEVTTDLQYSTYIVGTYHSEQ